MANNSKPFWCFGWHQQIFSYLCMHRYKKGMKQCEHCKKGKKLVARELDALREEAAGQVSSKE